MVIIVINFKRGETMQWSKESRGSQYQVLTNELKGSDFLQTSSVGLVTNTYYACSSKNT